MRGFINAALSFFIGAIALSLFSTTQKMGAGFPIVLKGYLVPVLAGGSFGLVIGIWQTRLKKNQEKTERLNLVLRTIRNVNQLLVNEKDRSRLLQGVCDNLIDNRGYYNAWIALFDESGGLVATVEAGLGKKFLPVVERLKRGKLTHCAQKALMQSEVVLNKDPFYNCTDCPLSGKYAGKGAMTLRLEHDGKVFGLLTVSIPAEIIVDEEEQSLFQEIAGDIAFGLYQMSLVEEQSKAEKMLRESEEKYRVVVENQKDLVVKVDAEGRFEFVNPSFCEIFGKTEDELLGKDFKPLVHNLIHEDDREMAVETIETLYRPPYSGYTVVRVLTKDGWRWIGWTDNAILDEKNNVISIVSVGRDITEIKEAELVLQKSQNDLGERVKEQNCLYEISKLIGKLEISLADILKGVVDLIPPAFQYPKITCARIVLEEVELKTRNFVETKWKIISDIFVHGELKGVLEVCYLEERLESDEGPFLKEERSLINAIAERIGRVIERKRAQDEIVEREKNFRDLVENSPTGIIIIQDNQVVYSNPEQDRMAGRLVEQFEPLTFKNIYPDDVEKVKQGFQKIISGEKRHVDMDFRFYPMDKIGSKPNLKWVYCRASFIEYQGNEAILVNLMDISRAKELEDFVRIKDKMSSLGRVAAGIAHEIRNPLSGINIYLNTLEKIYDREENFEKVREILGELQSASNKIESVVRRVMDFSKPSEPKLVLTDINKPVKEAIKLSAVTLRKRAIKIEKALDEDMSLCHADQNLIEQVILNLITNAVEAMKNMEGNKRIKITSSMGNDLILVRVSDSGPGVPLDLKDKIFDPFYTTKDDGTGIGLSLNHRIITDHGGSLDVSTNKWGGAEFRVEIPIAKN